MFSAHITIFSGDILFFGCLHQPFLPVESCEIPIFGRYKVGPQTIAQLVQITPTTMAYVTYNIYSIRDVFI